MHRLAGGASRSVDLVFNSYYFTVAAGSLPYYSNCLHRAMQEILLVLLVVAVLLGGAAFRRRIPPSYRIGGAFVFLILIWTVEPGFTAAKMLLTAIVVVSIWQLVRQKPKPADT